MSRSCLDRAPAELTYRSLSIDLTLWPGAVGVKNVRRGFREELVPDAATNGPGTCVSERVVDGDEHPHTPLDHSFSEMRISAHPGRQRPHRPTDRDEFQR
ncbi:hypothetical protein SAMN04487819_106191 [Actinopolyspora alba]|uniref:Uncharacterized protein n=1 Tax=Actinopolyspora alba TaxID=673379 RepID=A0A1I1WYD3_9ACTN|nr:hypothetical protein SAMN04487819_106191 [Actinopolyspora alba]